MSRSYRKPFEKDKNGKHHNCYNRRYRSSTKQITRVFVKSISVRHFWVTYWMYYCEIDEPVYPHKFEIMDAWTYCDYRITNWDSKAKARK